MDPAMLFIAHISISRDAWDMAVEICLSKLPQLVTDPTAEFQVSLIITFMI